jgi:hypothetical protein
MPYGHCIKPALDRRASYQCKFVNTLSRRRRGVWRRTSTAFCLLFIGIGTEARIAPEEITINAIVAHDFKSKNA